MSRVLPATIAIRSAAVGDLRARATGANTLTADEKAAGWKLLFDGKSLAGWRSYKTETAPGGWSVQLGPLSVSTRSSRTT